MSVAEILDWSRMSVAKVTQLCERRSQLHAKIPEIFKGRGQTFEFADGRSVKVVLAAELTEFLSEHFTSTVERVRLMRHLVESDGSGSAAYFPTFRRAFNLAEILKQLEQSPTIKVAVVDCIVHKNSSITAE